MDLSGRTHLHENVISDANNGPEGAAAPYGSLRHYEEFQLALADRVRQHFFNGGVFYVDPDHPAWDPAHPERNVPAARMVEITDVVSQAIVPESARWGDQHRHPPYTRNAEWQSELEHLLADFFPQRTAIVMDQLRAHNLYPDTEAPEFEVDGVRQHGGTVAAGALLGLDNPNSGQGTIWFTTDGSDPRMPGGAVNTASATRFTGPFPLAIAGTFKARILKGSEWSALSEAFFAFDQTGVRIAEVHFNPADPNEAELAVDPTFDNDDFEFIELVNVGNTAVELDGVQLVDGVKFDFSDAPSSRLAPAERIVVVRNIDAFSTRYAAIFDSITIAGQYEAALSNGGEVLKAIGALGEVLFEFEYGDDWFGLTDGGGYSLTVRDPSDNSADLNHPTAWRPSNLAGGSPGSADTAVDPAAVVIHELLATSDGTGWLELHNTTPEPIDIGHWYLSDSADSCGSTSSPPGRSCRPTATCSWTRRRNSAPVARTRRAGPIRLESPWRAAVLDRRRPARATARLSRGPTVHHRRSRCFPGTIHQIDGATDFVRMQSPTPGAANAQPTVGPIVINEIMYHPVSGESEFIELWNTSDAPLPLDNGQGLSWRVRGAIDFAFPAEAVIPAGGFALLLQHSAVGDPAAEAAAFAQTPCRCDRAHLDLLGIGSRQPEQ